MIFAEITRAIKELEDSPDPKEILDKFDSETGRYSRCRNCPVAQFISSRISPHHVYVTSHGEVYLLNSEQDFPRFDEDLAIGSPKLRAVIRHYDEALWGKTVYA